MLDVVGWPRFCGILGTLSKVEGWAWRYKPGEIAVRVLSLVSNAYLLYANKAICHRVTCLVQSENRLSVLLLLVEDDM